MGQVRPVRFYLYDEFIGQGFVDESDLHAGAYHTLEGTQYKVIKKSVDKDGLRADVELARARYTNLAKKSKTKKWR